MVSSGWGRRRSSIHYSSDLVTTEENLYAIHAKNIYEKKTVFAWHRLQSVSAWKEKKHHELKLPPLFLMLISSIPVSDRINNQDMTSRCRKYFNLIFKRNSLDKLSLRNGKNCGKMCQYRKETHCSDRRTSFIRTQNLDYLNLISPVPIS